MAGRTPLEATFQRLFCASATDLEFRRWLNAMGTVHDSEGWVVAAVITTIWLGAKVLLQDGQPYLALQASLSLLLAALLALLAGRRPALYAAWREPLVLLGCAAHESMTRHLALHSHTDLMAHHRDNAFVLLLHIILNNASIWMCLVTIHARMLLSWSAVALLATGLTGLPASEALCHRVLDVPGAIAPLARLHGWLMHNGLLFPVLREAASSSAHDPLSQCVTINVWSVGVVGVALPLVLLERLLLRARRTFDLQRQRQQQQGQGRQQQRRAADSDEPEPDALDGLRWMCLASMLSWAGGVLLALPSWPAPGGGSQAGAGDGT